MIQYVALLNMPENDGEKIFWRNSFVGNDLKKIFFFEAFGTGYALYRYQKRKQNKQIILETFYFLPEPFSLSGV